MTIDRSQFFDTPNVIQPSGQGVDSELARMSLDPRHELLVLPWREDGGRQRWYVVYPPDRSEQMREELAAHVGISYTDFRGQTTSLDRNDSGDLAAAALAENQDVTRVELLYPPGQLAVSSALLRLSRLWSQRPITTTRAQRPVAELLSSLKLALLSGDRGEAEQILDQLREGGDLDVINLLFLEIDLVSRFDGPVAILAHPQLGALVQIRRPARVTDILARAVDAALLRPDGETNPELLLERFRAIDERLKTLLVSAGECRSSSGLLLSCLRALQSDASVELPENRVFNFEVDATTASVLELIDARSARPRSDAEVEQVETKVSLGHLLESGRYEEVLALAMQSPRDFEVVDAALRAAQWLDSLTAAQQAIAILESATEAVRSRFTGNRVVSPLIEALRVVAREGTVPERVSDWNALLESVVGHPTWDHVVQAAEHGAIEWPVSIVAVDPLFGSRLAANITGASETAQSVFARLVPHLIEWMDRVPAQDRVHLLDAFEALMAYFTFNDRSRVGLDLLGAFASDVLAVGLTDDRYRFCLDSLEIRWEAAASPSTVVWAADILASLIDQSCPNGERRLTLATKLVRSVASFADRVDLQMLDFIRTLAKHLGLEALLPQRPAVVLPPSGPAPGPLLVGVYSLTPGALVRARDALQAQWPHMTVECRSDHVASEQLRQLARRADLMVVATRSALHEATICINATRPPGRPTIFPSGKGSASILRAVQEWVANAGQLA